MAVATGTAIALGAVAGLAGSAMGANAQKSAANQANQTLNQQNTVTRADQLPYMQRGNAAGNMLSYLMGIGNPAESYKTQGNFDAQKYLAANPDAQAWIAANTAIGRTVTPWDHYVADGSQRAGDFWRTTDAGQIYGGAGSFGSLLTPFSQSTFQADPGYQFRLAEGAKALERSAASKGMSLSGAQAKALTGYNQNFASNEYNNAYTRYNNDQTNLFNRLSGIAGTGQQANQFVVQMGANTAAQIGQNQLGAGNATAAGWVSGTNAIAGGLNSWNNWNMWNSMNSPGAYSITGSPGSSSPNFGNNWGQPVPYATGG